MSVQVAVNHVLWSMWRGNIFAMVLNGDLHRAAYAHHSYVLSFPGFLYPLFTGINSSCPVDVP